MQDEVLQVANFRHLLQIHAPAVDGLVGAKDGFGDVVLFNAAGKETATVVSLIVMEVALTDVEVGEVRRVDAATVTCGCVLRDEASTDVYRLD